MSYKSDKTDLVVHSFTQFFFVFFEDEQKLGIGYLINLYFPSFCPYLNLVLSYFDVDYDERESNVLPFVHIVLMEAFSSFQESLPRK